MLLKDEKVSLNNQVNNFQFHEINTKSPIHHNNPPNVHERAKYSLSILLACCGCVVKGVIMRCGWEDCTSREENTG